MTDAIRDVVRDLLVDARGSYRDARRWPERAAELVPYADRIRATARALRQGAPHTVDRYGWPTLTAEAN